MASQELARAGLDRATFEVDGVRYEMNLEDSSTYTQFTFRVTKRRREEEAVIRDPSEDQNCP